VRAIGYIRVSTQGQAEAGVSMDAQEAKIKAWAGLNETEVVICRDDGISGKRSDNRPGLQAALSMIGKGDALVVYSLSRLSRSTKDALILSEILTKKDADLVSLSEKIDTTSASGKMVFRLLAVLNEFERDQTSDRTRFALAHKRTLGEFTGGKIPYGYRLDGKLLVADEFEQTALRLIRDLRVEGYTLRAICRKLEARGYRTKSGNPSWHPQVVKQLITHPGKAA